MISIGGVIGTGLFLGSAVSPFNEAFPGGPVLIQTNVELTSERGASWGFAWLPDYRSSRILSLRLRRRNDRILVCSRRLMTLHMLM